MWFDTKFSHHFFVHANFGNFGAGPSRRKPLLDEPVQAFYTPDPIVNTPHYVFSRHGFCSYFCRVCHSGIQYVNFNAM